MSGKKETKKRKLSFKNVVGGKLSLKGTAAPVKDSKKKRKKRKKEKLNAEFEKFVQEKEKETAEKAADEDEEKLLRAAESYDDTLTDSQRQFARAQAAREKSLIGKKIQKTHRQRIEAFNEYLSKLTEHNDIPKVGPG